MKLKAYFLLIFFRFDSEISNHKLSTTFCTTVRLFGSINDLQ